MQLHGKNIIAGQPTASGPNFFAAFNPRNGQWLSPDFCEATPKEATEAMLKAFVGTGSRPPEKVAAFLEAIAEELLRIGDDLVARAHLETGLPEARLTGERARTVNQIKMFAALVREGSWVDARIDRAQPARTPAPKPDLRRMLAPIGPVVVFGASNFPLAFSVAGGDTISALAAGNPVVVKAHPAHPGTSEIAGQAIVAAAQATGMPPEIFSMLQGRGNEVGLHLVKFPSAKAVAFTGSLQGGRALFDAAAARPEPIPVYAEMGSTNPVFVLPGAMKSGVDALAGGLMQSVTLGVGQFCTKPGVVFGIKSAEWDALQTAAAKIASTTPNGVMLTAGITERFAAGSLGARKADGVRTLAEGGAIVLAVDSQRYRATPSLHEEIFGPAVIFVTCGDSNDMHSCAAGLSGQLTASIHATESELADPMSPLGLIQENVGRVIFNGWPTGVEVCPSMHHGGPYPATTSPLHTSVGTAAIARFARPVCFQNFPDAALPPALRNRNAGSLWRLIDGQRTREDA